MQATSTQQLAALAVVLDHPGLASDPLLLCSAARVCVSWQEAVAASGAGTTNITLHSSTVDALPEGPNPSELERGQCLLNCVEHLTMQKRRAQGLPAWLARHAHLVHGLRLSGDLGLCAAYALAESCADPSAVAAGLRLPRLQQFSADRHVTPGLRPELLAALPDGLSELELTGADISEEDSCTASALMELLQRLKQLKVLHIGVESSASKPLDLSPLCDLCHLTRLKLSGMGSEADWINIQQALPCLTALQGLHLDCYEAFDSAAGRALPLGGLTGLQHLCVSLGSELPGPGTRLPAQLSALVLACDGLPPMGSEEPAGCPVEALGLSSLSYLRRFKIIMCSCPLDNMSSYSVALQQLTQVTHMELEYQSLWASYYDNNYWGTLPALRTLRFTNEVVGGSVHVSHAESIFAGVARATSLVHLEMAVMIDVSTQKENNCLSLGFCQQLTGLTKLQVLQLQLLEGDIAARDCIHLSSLSNLTRLNLKSFDGPVDDTVAVALALSLPQLRHLDLTECGLQTDAVLAALAQREQLTELQLRGNSGIPEDVLADIRQFNAEGSPSLRSILLRSGTTREDAG